MCSVVPKKRKVCQSNISRSMSGDSSTSLSVPVGLKRMARTPDYRIRFEDVTSLLRIVHSVVNVVERACFKIEKVQDIFFLKVDTQDVSNVCHISVRYRLEGFVDRNEDASEPIRFSVNCKHFSANLMNIPSHHVVWLEGDTTTCIPKLIVRTKDVDNPSHETVTELDTYLDNDDEKTLTNMTYDMTLELDLHVFRNLLKIASTANAETLVIRIVVEEATKESNPMSFIKFSVHGDFKHSQIFAHEVIRGDDGSMIVRAASDSEHAIVEDTEVSPTYEAVFPLDKISGFVKLLQSRMLVAKIKKGTPIMFQHILGGSVSEGSHIKFLVAEKWE